jgi:hypothetical protein
MSKSTSWYPSVSAAARGSGVVWHAGTVLLLRTAERTGLSSRLSAQLGAGPGPGPSTSGHHNSRTSSGNAHVESALGSTFCCSQQAQNPLPSRHFRSSNPEHASLILKRRGEERWSQISCPCRARQRSGAAFTSGSKCQGRGRDAKTAVATAAARPTQLDGSTSTQTRLRAYLA